MCGHSGMSGRLHCRLDSDVGFASALLQRPVRNDTCSSKQGDVDVFEDLALRYAHESLAGLHEVVSWLTAMLAAERIGE